METFFLHAQEKDAQELAERIRIPSGTNLPVDWQGQLIIHWGAAHDEYPQKLALQPIKAIMRAQNRRKRDALLQLHGIKTITSQTVSSRGKREPVLFTHKYKVAVFHLQTLLIYEKKETVLLSEKSLQHQRQVNVNAAYIEVGPSQINFHSRRASRESVKAIYALGLDYGLVTIGITPSGHTLVLDVDPVPKLNGRLVQLFAQAIDQYDQSLAKELERKERAVLGCDPEFLLVNPQGKVVFADRFLTRDGAVGSDAIVLSGHRVILPLAELRPQPSVDPLQLAKNVRVTMGLAARKITDHSLAWCSGGMPVRGYPLGGHLHFSRCWMNGHLLRALDNYLALPLILIEDESTRGRRPRYGYLGDFRKKSHGGFEYRTLPSWLASPVITRGVFALAALIVNNYWRLTRKPLQEPDIQAAYYSGDKRRLQDEVAKLWKDLEQLKGYEVHAALLEGLRSQITSMVSWNEMADIRFAWKIAPGVLKEAFDEGIML
ncbi:hypothetical protein PAECIP111891_00953 [Paenibacillus allorhizoplanae]|uniref:Phage phiEco32-like COOH-NH2 ligase-type 2 n=1 Tax=Paenibacillus allorhizoplanae TaxID=2905648 RepID=A0ABN8G7B7_9BACL|nr:hypothetical protein [Paenibacillus allorhizoplanae]CAH1196782.1 hypothetical protein PAECIP111891_00953 [Paenibacillus allorhizoplanae]